MTYAMDIFRATYATTGNLALAVEAVYDEARNSNRDDKDLGIAFIGLCRELGISQKTVKSRYRGASAARDRATVWRKLYDLGYSYSAIGRCTGHNHATVRNGVLKKEPTK